MKTTPEDERLELKDAVKDASQAHLGRTRRHRREWSTCETTALAEQARLARIQSAPNHRDLRRQTTRALRLVRNAYLKAIAEETGLYQVPKSVSRRPDGVGEILLERGGSVTQHHQTLYFHHWIPRRWKTILVKLTRPIWRRCALPSDSICRNP